MVVDEKKQIINKWYSTIINLLIFIFSSTGFFLSCLFAKRDGYYHWLTRLLYFTQQSNLWIGITSLIFAIMIIKNRKKENFKLISLFKFIFTVSITITGFIFCSVLAPFADYNVWTFASVLTHVIVPLMSIFDYFTDRYIINIENKKIWICIIPPLTYFVFTSILCIMKVDFGRGDPYPYFFMDYYSEVGLFGFVFKWPPQIGSFYWIVFLFSFTYGLGYLYYKIHFLLVRKRINN
ncbi:MAG: hypothetical protein E7180_04650 [Erysipelotrichaceae bacterium]|nr:hypothetical protein [Erysipelotrichaceae bacterium]